MACRTSSPAAHSDLVVKVFGDDLRDVRRIAGEVATTLPRRARRGRRGDRRGTAAAQPQDRPGPRRRRRAMASTRPTWPS
ncbi:hypothetical protein ACU4GD_16220 [Cupriavidus basilensis]